MQEMHINNKINQNPWPVSEVLIQEHLFQPFASYLEKILPRTEVCLVKWPQATITAVRKYAKDEGLKVIIRMAKDFNYASSNFSCWRVERPSS
jgi:hypothetical protein